MSAHTTGCGDNSCVFKVLRTGSGMATNGGCRCFSALVAWNEAVQQDVQRLVVELRRARTSKADLLEALQDLTAQIMADWQADCTELLPESAEFKAALVAIAKAEGDDGYCMRRPDGTIECRRFVCHQPCAARPGAVSDVEVDASDYERPGKVKP